MIEPAPPPRRRRTALVTLAIVAILGGTAYALVRVAFPEGSGGGHTGGPTSTEGLDDVLDQAGDALGGQDDLLRCMGLGAVAPGTLPAPTGGLRKQIREVARQVEEIRGLSFERAVEPRLLSGDRVASRVREQVGRQYPAEMAEADRRVLEALGAISPGTDLRAALGRALGSQVAGFYEPRTGELVVRTAGEGLGTIERITLAHELEHALADQSLDLPVPERTRPGNEDGDLAALSLVEGDATMTMQRYSVALSLEEQLGLLDPKVVAQAEAGLSGLPDYLRRQLIFPYQAGLEFVCHLYLAGGWKAVNAAYGSPPDATAEVLFPERFPDEEEDPRDPGTLSGSWKRGPVRSFGAAGLLWLFEAPGGDPADAIPQPLEAVRGWSGGELQLWTRGTDTALGIALAELGREDLCGPVVAWYRAAFPDARGSAAGAGERMAVDGTDQDAVVTCPEGEVRMGIAPSLEEARSLVTAS